MRNPKKQNASPEEGAQLTKLAGSVKAKRKVFLCGVQHISKLRREVQRQGLELRNTTGKTQCETLLRVLEYLSERGLNTPEGVGIGYYRIATRIQELEAEGWHVASQRESLIGADGLYHIGISRYVLIGRRADFIDPQGCLDLGAA